MERNYALEDFKINKYAYGVIESDGSWSNYSGKYDINYSSILSRLIQEAGRFCENFASDLFIDWQSIELDLEKPDFSGGVYLFGFRQSGVDHNTFVLSRYNSEGDYAKHNYRSLWRLDISVNDRDIKMELGRCF